MNTLVPLSDYFDVWINTFLFLVLFTLLHTWVLKINDTKNIAFINIAGYILLVFVIFYIGQRPISGRYFGDMRTYVTYFYDYQMGAEIKGTKDIFFHVFMKASSYAFSVHGFFTLCAMIYILPLVRISKVFFKEYWYYSFFMFLVSYSFYTYGVNGIRNGAAASLFLLGVSFKDKKILMGLCFLAALSFHKTMFLPITAFLITYVYNSPKFYLKGWLLCIPLSLALGSVWIALFANLGFGDDDRLAGYLTTQAEEGTFSQTGFRWDFLFHSAFAVFAGWYFIFKKKFVDSFYNQLLNTYLICNGFWILVINANFSNRFAYLSWFMMAIVIVYPMLKERLFKNHHIMLGKIVFVYFLFTYSMYYLYAG
ncbi:EpsG family protein [Sabulilitoribacter multivorans]|uniref:EpsG family protein n=1 Tax=Flaviramulus multivorans TaxID=1304750 RepID=A0ABS9IJL8_9FLAO|nr:EpsG family protein [Flaviramulus multivorans]MCF7560784.1 EpsG family protein [Flaviramulus multivorans]